MAENIKEKVQNMGESLKQKWDELKTEFRRPETEPQTKPRPRMSGGFNASAMNNDTADNQYEEQPEAKTTESPDLEQ